MTLGWSDTFCRSILSIVPLEELLYELLDMSMRQNLSVPQLGFDLFFFLIEDIHKFPQFVFYNH